MARGLLGQQLAASPFASWYLRLKCVLNQRGNDCRISISNQVIFAYVFEKKQSQYHTVTVACLSYQLKRRGLLGAGAGGEINLEGFTIQGMSKAEPDTRNSWVNTLVF